jgi:hypothetical protein
VKSVNQVAFQAYHYQVSDTSVKDFDKIARNLSEANTTRFLQRSLKDISPITKDHMP